MSKTIFTLTKLLVEAFSIFTAIYLYMAFTVITKCFINKFIFNTYLLIKYRLPRDIARELIIYYDDKLIDVINEFNLLFIIRLFKQIMFK